MRELSGAAQQLLSQALSRQGELVIPSRGDSMLPLIRQGSRCTFAPAVLQDLVRGDIVLFRGAGGELIGHRYYGLDGAGRLCCKGDSNAGFDAPVPPERLIGRLTEIRRGRLVLRPEDAGCRAWGSLVMGIPWLSMLMRRLLRTREALLRRLPWR